MNRYSHHRGFPGFYGYGLPLLGGFLLGSLVRPQYSYTYPQPYYPYPYPQPYYPYAYPYQNTTNYYSTQPDMYITPQDIPVSGGQIENVKYPERPRYARCYSNDR